MGTQPLTGGKVRRLRKARGLTQAELARRLSISASYLNLIEHGQRALTLPIRRGLARVLGIDEADLSDSNEAQVLADLQEIFADALFDDERPNAAELRELVLRSPAAARGIQTLYGRLRGLRSETHALAERVTEGSELFGVPPVFLPSEEVSDLIQRHDNHFPELEEAAERLWGDAQIDGQYLRLGLLHWLEKEHGVRVVITPSERDLGAVRRFDAAKRELQISEVLPRSAVVFQLAHQIGLLGLGDELEKRVSEARLSMPDSRALARVALANYFAGAVAMPYQRFLEAAQRGRYDVELLEHRFRTSYEQVCHRLTTLRRPGARGIPFHLVRIDIAGNISKHFSGSGIRFARYGGACPRWNVHAAFLTPGQIRTQVSVMPDGMRFFEFARTVRKAGGGHLISQSRLAIGMGCDVAHADRIVYADGLDLGSEVAAVPVGVSCRLCERLDCRQRAFPPIHHRMKVDENVRGLSFYCTPGDGER
jgi:hypothetical protein